MSARLGSLLVQLGFISEDQLLSALDEQEKSGKRLGRILLDARVIREEELVRTLSRQLGIPKCNPLAKPLDPALKRLIPENIVRTHRVFPLELRTEDGVHVVSLATSDPLDPTPIRVVRAALGESYRTKWMIAGENELEVAIERAFSLPPTPPEEAILALTTTDVYFSQDLGGRVSASTAPEHVVTARADLDAIARSASISQERVAWAVRLFAALALDTKLVDDEMLSRAIERRTIDAKHPNG